MKKAHCITRLSFGCIQAVVPGQRHVHEQVRLGFPGVCYVGAGRVSHRHTARASSHRPGVEHRRRMLHRLLMFLKRVSSILIRLSLGGKKKGGVGLNPTGQSRPSHTSHLRFLGSWRGGTEVWPGIDYKYGRHRARGIGPGNSPVMVGKEETARLCGCVGRKEFRAAPAPPWSLSRGRGPWAERGTIIKRYNHR